MLASDEHSEKVLGAMLTSPSGSIMLVNDVHLEKAELPISLSP